MTQNGYKITALFLTAVISVFGYLKLQSDEPKEKLKAENCEIVNMDSHVKVDSAIAVNNDFYYHIGPRFNPVKLSKVKAARNFSDIADDSEINLSELERLEIQNIIYERRGGIKIEGSTADFNLEQLQYLKELTYSDHFLLAADFMHRNELHQQIPEHISPHFTVVPEKQAYYKEGNRNLLNYIREANREITDGSTPEELGTSLLYFVIDKAGKVKDLYFDHPSALPFVDAKLSEIMNSLPGEWEAAENASGEKVEQQLVLTFGMDGC